MKKKDVRHSSRFNKKLENEKILGILSVNTQGVGYLKQFDHKKNDIEIQNSDLNTALNGDTVLVTPYPLNRRDRPTGRVISIKKRARRDFVGVLQKKNNTFFLLPDDKRMYAHIILEFNDVKHFLLEIGNKIQVKIVHWDKGGLPKGKIIEKLGFMGEHNTEMKSILYESGFFDAFSDQMEREAKKIASNKELMSAKEIAQRRDFRKVTTFTIDPEEAKDFDDALSLRVLTNGNFEIGVHIADVSHFIREKTALDEEALKREFSVYLVDRTIPMLPEAISNNICSLNPQQERLTFSTVFEMSKNGEILSRWFGKTVIKSCARFSYEAVEKILDCDSLSQYSYELKTLNFLAQKLRKKKINQGALDFGQDEVSFVLDEYKKPIKIFKKPRLKSHQLVEEFMLLANKEVAEFIYHAYRRTNSESPFIYRIHDLPDREKVSALSLFVRALGYNLHIKKDRGVRAIDFQSLLKQIEGKAEESIIKTAVMRSMSKAIYSIKNIGHFGLAFEFYTHFTSPIRRYPDLLVHRLLFHHLNGEKLSKSEWIKYEKISTLATEKEIKAAEAERESKKYKQVEFMQDKLGQVFEGFITGVTGWGIYVEEKETKSEGLIKISDLGNEYFIFDEKNYCLLGEKTKTKFSLGDSLRFRIIATSLAKRTIDCVLA